MRLPDILTRSPEGAEAREFLKQKRAELDRVSKDSRTPRPTLQAQAQMNLALLEELAQNPSLQHYLDTKPNTRIGIAIGTQVYSYMGPIGVGYAFQLRNPRSLLYLTREGVMYDGQRGDNDGFRTDKMTSDLLLRLGQLKDPELVKELGRMKPQDVVNRVVRKVR